MGKVFSKKRKTQVTTKIGREFNCPLCNSLFYATTNFNQLNAHIIACAQDPNRIIINDTINAMNEVNSKEININKAESLNINKMNSVVEPISSISNKTNKITENIVQPKPNDFQKKYYSTTSKNNKTPPKKMNFEVKIINFRNALQIRKIDWRDAYCKLEINREHFFEESIKKFKLIDPLKELKINFLGEISHDAGGIIREWFYIMIKELQSSKYNLFERANTDEFSYVVHKNILPTLKNLEYFHFLGRLIAKALLDNITINLCFNKLFYKLILDEDIVFEDLVFIDRPLFNSLKELRRNQNVESLCLYYCIQYKDEDGDIISDELIPGGENILVKNEDVEDYIEKRIEYLIEKSQLFTNEIKHGLYDVIPSVELEKFNSDEFELLLNGQPFIDLDDWKQNTIYQGKYNPKNKVIKWFWDVLFDLSQEELSNLLQFCTGSSRVPIGGFSMMESNRGEIAKFCIIPLEYKVGSKNYIKSHTCFNRMELPLFVNIEELKDAIKYVINGDIIGFGMD